MNGPVWPESDRPAAAGPVDGLVVHVGKIDHEFDLVAPPEQLAVQQVVDHEGAEVADVRVIVDRGPASVDGDAPGAAGSKRRSSRRRESYSFMARVI